MNWFIVLAVWACGVAVFTADRWSTFYKIPKRLRNLAFPEIEGNRAALRLGDRAISLFSSIGLAIGFSIIMMPIPLGYAPPDYDTVCYFMMVAIMLAYSLRLEAVIHNIRTGKRAEKKWLRLNHKCSLCTTSTPDKNNATCHYCVAEIWGETTPT
jgi:hypothetical protein